MEFIKIIDLLSFTIPAIVVGIIAYYFFLNHTKAEENKMKLRLLKEKQKDSLPIKLQAYERLTLFIERINPSKLLLRVSSINNDKNAYVQSLIRTIEQEFEHNLTQQIYISEKCWNVIITSKNATIQLINKTANESTSANAQELRESILQKMINSTSPSTTAIAFIKDEVRNLL
ncbi:MAG: hypothetical protein JKY16_02585 [Lutibacter sp.]|nr:hypothetical protein [Lutibacter sp.]